MAGTSAAFNELKTVVLMRAEGSRSAIPMSLVHSTVNSLSGDVPPSGAPVAAQKACATSAAPFISETGVFERRI